MYKRMTTKNYYEILNLEKRASEEEIKKSYKKLALLYHPDRNQGNPESCEKFKEVNEAYTILSNSDKRKQYDMMGVVDESFDGTDPFSVFNNIFQQHMGNFMNMRYDDNVDIANIFGMQQSSFPGGNIHVRVHTFPIHQENEDDFEPPNIVKNLFSSMFKEKSNMFKEKTNDKSLINGKPDDIIYNINVSFADIYNMKKKKITIIRNRIKNKVSIEKKKKIEIPIFGKEILLEKEGHELKNYKERGNVIINIFNNKDKDFRRVNEYDILTTKDININQIYSAFVYELILPHGEVLLVQSEKIKNKEHLIQKIPNKGLPYENDDNKKLQGNLYVLYKIIFPDTFEELKNITDCVDTSNIDDNYTIAYNCDFNDIFSE